MDQAQGLRQLAGARRARVIAVTSGKGGVGKSNLALNLGLALHDLGVSVLIIDADLGLANIDVLLGASAPYHLGHVRRGEKHLEDVVYSDPSGLRIIGGGSGIPELLNVTRGAMAVLLREIARLESMVDVVLVDTGAGLGATVQAFLQAADEVVLVSTPEPTALTDGYVVLRELWRSMGGVTPRLVINRAQGVREAEAAARALTVTCQRFLGAQLPLWGFIPEDAAVSRAVRAQVPFLRLTPRSPAALKVRELAGSIAGLPLGSRPAGLLHFVDRVLRRTAQEAMR